VRAAVIMSLLCMLAADVIAAEQAPYFSGTFTNLTYRDESADLTGMEVTLIPQSDGSYFALVQIAEGQTPLILTGSATATGNSIRIMVAGKPPMAGTYTGTLSFNALLLQTPSGLTERLKRGRSYWQ
jgi:hypothetical protein